MLKWLSDHHVVSTSIYLQPLQVANFKTGKKWFDCAECHAETEQHQLKQQTEMVKSTLPLLCQPSPHLSPISPYIANSLPTQTFACKKCRKVFRKDAQEFEESDEYCPHCDNHFVLEALTPKPMLKFEGEDARVDSRMIKDERLRGKEDRTIFDVEEAPNKLG